MTLLSSFVLTTFLSISVNAATKIMPLGDSITGSPASVCLSILMTCPDILTFRDAGERCSGKILQMQGRLILTLLGLYRPRNAVLRTMGKTRVTEASLQ